MGIRNLYWILTGPSFAVHHDGKIIPDHGERGGASFTLVTITYKVAVYAPAERADTLPLFHLYHYMYSMVVTPLTIFPSTIV